MPTTFPTDFVWGAATASYQIEGAWREAGKGESIWDRFCHHPGNIADGDTGDIACDHYHRWPEEIALMRDMGLKAYRFSISWPRILPSGFGQVNSAGLDFYSRLVDGLLDAGIVPYATLYHWDLPQTLEDRGGWPQRDTAKAFLEFAELTARSLGDRVKDWITLNEPWVSAFHGYHTGEHAPGIQSIEAAVPASHHLLLAHGMSVPIIRRDSSDAKVGITLNLGPQVPASSSQADHVAASLEDGKLNRWFLDPLIGRGYPEDVVEAYGVPMDFISSGDMAAIEAHLDFLGVNFYFRGIARSEEIPEAKNKPRELFPNPDPTAMGWEVHVPALLDLLTWLHDRYRFPRYFITENGAAYEDQVEDDGRVVDPERIAYLKAHLLAASQAIDAGVPLHGYFVWSLLDNFEWARGYSKRFGLIYLDYETLERIPKASADWYRQVIATQSIED